MPRKLEPKPIVDCCRNPIGQLEIAMHDVHRQAVQRAAQQVHTRLLLMCLCAVSASCAQEPPPAPPPDTRAQDAAEKLNAASIALRKEERKLLLLKRDLQPQEQAAAYHVFSTTLRPGLTLKGLRTVYLDPRRGGESISFDEPDDRTDAEKENLQKVREFANKFAAECKQPDSPTAKKIAAEIDALPVTKELRQQQELVDKLTRERNEAQAAMPPEKPRE
jgi:hypothetical protein